MVELQTWNGGLVRWGFLFELRYYHNPKKAIARGWWKTWFTEKNLDITKCIETKKRRKSSMHVLLNMLKLCSWHWTSLRNVHFCNPTTNLSAIAVQIACPEQLQQISKTASVIYPQAILVQSLNNILVKRLHPLLQNAAMGGSFIVHIGFQNLTFYNKRGERT